MLCLELNILQTYFQGLISWLWKLFDSESYFSAAQRVLQKCPISMAGCELTTNQYVEEPMVKISGVPQDFSEEILKLFFESRKKSDGGNIKDISMLLSMKVAIITFEDAAGNFAFYNRPQQ